MLENHILNFTAEFSISNQQQHSIWKVSNDLFKHLNQKAVIFLLCKSSNMAYYKCIFVNSIFLRIYSLFDAEMKNCCKSMAFFSTWHN